MEFSKLWLAGNAAVSGFLILLCIFGVNIVEITIAQLGLTATSAAFYFWKAKNENRAKYAQKFIRQWAKEFGLDAVAQIMEIILRD